ncbi:Ferritin heavy chain [Habropoda laboriosa]|uniref:Ferritin n=1 Tax=Habropoda laboriosa TaxID=597456 RepID=A0A0L7R7T4_9HYME|nr:PREDICTED: soma ferritin-like [Habropoda laboriosa]KOC66888.1 Ferritin heavy chain [Habropoda laboriosa]
MLKLYGGRKTFNNVLHSYIRQLYKKEITFHKEPCNSKILSAKYLATSSSDEKSKGFCIDKPTKWPSGKPANFKLHQVTEAILNEQINAELKAFYYYLSMAAYFGRADVALPGCESFFMQMHHEEHEHALRFVNYVKMRGGCVHLCPIQSPDDQDWKCPLHAFKTALELETEITEKLVAVNTVAETYSDLNASDFIVTGFMEDQMKSVNEMGRFVAILSGIGDQALARFIFDKDLLENHVTPKFNILHTKMRPNGNDN